MSNVSSATVSAIPWVLIYYSREAKKMDDDLMDRNHRFNPIVAIKFCHEMKYFHLIIEIVL